MTRPPLGTLIVVATLVRLAAGYLVGLGVDESYMVAAGRVWQLSYFDHPPIAWWLSHGMAALTGSEAPIVVRLPFIALAALSTWLLFRLTERAFGDRAAWWAALCFTLAPVLSLSGGSWVLPDGPAECALLAAAVCLSWAVETRATGWWLGAGAAAGLALLSKYSAVLPLFGALIYLLSDPDGRRSLTKAGPWLAGLLALAMQAPVLIWNIEHDWVSLAFQGGRAAARGLHPLGPLQVIAGEAAFMLPWIWLPCVVGLWQALRGPRRGPCWMFACLGAPAVILFAVVAAWSPKVLMHWAAPGYLLLLPLAGRLIAERHAATARWFAYASTALVLAGLAGLVAVSRFGWPDLVRPADVAQVADWDGLLKGLAMRGEGRGPVAGLRWLDCGKIGYGLGPDRTILCLTDDARQFGFMTAPGAHRGDTVLVLAPRISAEEAATRLAGYFDRIVALPPLTLHMGAQDMAIPAYRGIGLHTP